MSAPGGRPEGPGSEPPRFVRFVLRLLLPKGEREFYLGDLRESGRRGWLREVVGAAALRFSPRRPSIRPGHVLADLRLGMRQLIRTPGASLTAFLALSIGIGLAGMMFSLMRGGLLPTLPVPNGERMVRVQHEDYSPTPADLFNYWTERQGSFEGLGVSADAAVALIIDGAGGEPVSGAAIDVGTLPLLSTEPVVGRSFVPADAVPGAPKVALIGYDVWQSRMDGDPDVLGRTIRMNGEPATVIGVMPEGFGFPFSAQVWTALNVHTYEPENRNESLFVYGLRREGVSNAAAAAELNELALQLPRAASDPEPAPVRIIDYTNIVNPSRVTYILAGLMVAVALLMLMVACANVTNVLLARAAVRAREVAVRTALGASRARIAMQFWTEATVLAVAGAVGGGVLAGVGVSAVRRAADIPGMPFWFDLRVDGPVLAFIAASAVLAAMAAGVLPALHAARPNGHDLLKDASRGSSSRRLGRMMGRLVGVQLTVSFVLLVASGLFIRSALNLQSYDFQFEPEGVYTANVRLPDATYESVQDRLAFVEELEERLEATPGVSRMTLATVFPGIGHRQARVAVEGVQDPGAADLPRVGTALVSPGFFETFEAPVLSGRAFDWGDRPGELPVAIVNEAFAEAYLPNGALGRRVALPTGDDAPTWLTIVGVAPDFLAPGIDPEHPREVVYAALAQDPPISMNLSVRAVGAASALAAPVREITAEVDPDVAVYFMRTLQEALVAANASFIWLSALFVLAGVLALFLAAIGLYGVMAFWVSQRRREIGVRMAIGGGGSRIVGFVVRQGMARIAFGLVAGALLSLPVAWGFRGALLDVSPFDPVVFGTVLAVLLGAGALGCILPALSATRVDPNTVLSSE
ncbi:MAG: ADOP family duplicated permease [Gemmatimonadota bacterium]|jgi:predicted permease